MAMEDDGIWVSAPTKGIKLGMGYDSEKDQLKSITGIDFSLPDKDPAQEKNYTITEVADKFSLMTALDISVGAQYEAAMGRVEGKAKFCNQQEIKGFFKSYVATAEVSRIQNCLPTKDDEQSIRLMDSALRVLEKNYLKFSQMYGDSFISGIEEGAELNVVMTFETIKKDTQIDLDVALSGSYGGFSADAATKLKQISQKTNTKTVIKYHQTGGSGDTTPLDIDGFGKKIEELPGLAKTNPMIYKIRLQRYDSLPNWPAQKSDINPVILAKEKLIRRYFEYSSAFNDIAHILNNSKLFGLGRGINETDLQKAQDELHIGMVALKNKFKEFENGKELTEEIPKEAEKPDYKFRILMPLPIDSYYEFNKMEPRALADKIFNMYIDKIADVRSKAYAEDPDYLDITMRDYYKNEILKKVIDVSWRDIGHANNVVGLTGLNGKLYCVTNQNRLYVREPVHSDIGWTDIGHANNVVGLTGLNGKLYCVTNQNRLYVREPVHSDIGWTDIGHANNVVGLTGLNDKLYCVTNENKLYVREPVHSDIGWTLIYDAPSGAKLAGLNDILYCATIDHRLKASNIK
jgi:hypothetical protein